MEVSAEPWFLWQLLKDKNVKTKMQVNHFLTNVCTNLLTFADIKVQQKPIFCTSWKHLVIL